MKWLQMEKKTPLIHWWLHRFSSRQNRVKNWALTAVWPRTAALPASTAFQPSHQPCRAPRVDGGYMEGLFEVRSEATTRCPGLECPSSNWGTGAGLFWPPALQEISALYSQASWGEVSLEDKAVHWCLWHQPVTLPAPSWWPLVSPCSRTEPYTCRNPQSSVPAVGSTRFGSLYQGE